MNTIAVFTLSALITAPIGWHLWKNRKTDADFDKCYPQFTSWEKFFEKFLYVSCLMIFIKYSQYSIFAVITLIIYNVYKSKNKKT